MLISVLLTALSVSGLYFLSFNTLSLSKNIILVISVFLFIFIKNKFSQIIILGSLCSIFVVSLVAFFELNFYAYFYRDNPQSLGIISDVAQIKETILKNNTVPKILVSPKESKSAIIKISQMAVGIDNFYGQSVLAKFPTWLIFSRTSDQPNVLLIDDTLILSQLDPHDFQTLTPTLGYLMIQKYFTHLPVKHFPRVEIIDDEQYIKFRRNEFIDKLKQIDTYQAQTKTTIATHSSHLISLDNDQATVSAKIQKIYAEINRTKNIQLYGQATALTNLLDQIKTNRLDIETKLSDSQKLYQFFEYQKNLGEKLIDNIPSERGAFFPPDTIKMTLNTNNPHSVADNLQLFVHEYFHYASYVNNDNKLNNPFFEEGLTEYYARQVIKRHLQINTNLGYPVLNIIFTKLAKNLPDPDLLEIYFTKNEAALERLLNRVYGKNFYSQNQGLFVAIQSTNNRNQLLPLANLLMSKINGPPLTEVDLISTFSNY